MKAILEFSAEEIIEGEMQTCLDGWKYRFVINEIFDRFIRQKVKYDESTTEDQQKLLEDLQEFILEELHDKGLTLTSLC